MDKMWVVLKREFMERVRTKWFLISTILGPLFFAALMILPAWLAVRERGSGAVADVTVIDATGAGIGERVARALADSLGRGGAAPNVVTVAPEGLAAAESAATAAVVRRERRGYLVLDSATLAGRRARYAGRNASSLADVERVREVVQRQVLGARLEREGLSPDRVRALTGVRFRMPTERLTDEGRGGSGAGNAVVALVLAFLLYMMILLYGQNVLRSVLEEKTTRVAEVVVASVRPDYLMAGKVLGVGAVGLLQQVIWFGGAALIGAYVAPFVAAGLRRSGGGAAAPAAPAAGDLSGAGALAGFDVGVVFAAVGFFLLGYVLYSALFAAAGAMVNSEQEAQQAAFPVMLPLILAAVFIQVVLRNPDAPAAKFAAWFPLTAPVIMPMRMSLTSVSALETAAVLAGVALSGVAAVWLAARIYRVGLLMYGKRPTIPELARWVRQAG